MTASSALARVRRVRVGSANVPKIEAVRGAVAIYAPDVQVEGSAVDSGVSDQPVGFEEIVRGARNRAASAYALGGCDLAVGYEDGLVELAELAEGSDGAEVMNIGCAAVTDGEFTSIGLSSGFAYPPGAAQRAISEREPIGDLFDTLWREHAPAAYNSEGEGPSAQLEGNIGKLSLGGLTRSEYARHAVVNALYRFLHPDLYETSRARRSVA